MVEKQQLYSVGIFDLLEDEVVAAVRVFLWTSVDGVGRGAVC